MSEQVPYTPPEYRKEAFHCPHCGIYSRHEWTIVIHGYYQPAVILGLEVAYCVHCRSERSKSGGGLSQPYTVWYERKMIYPESISVAPPSPDLGIAIREDYQEARVIVNDSPRGAAALLRLCIQKLCKQLGEQGKDMNTDISNLVQKGLPREIQEALDVVRVTGNSAVHPGQIDIQDNRDIAMSLFQLVNRMTDVMITARE